MCSLEMWSSIAERSFSFGKQASVMTDGAGPPVYYKPCNYLSLKPYTLPP